MKVRDDRTRHSCLETFIAKIRKRVSIYIIQYIYSTIYCMGIEIVIVCYHDLKYLSLQYLHTDIKCTMKVLFLLEINKKGLTYLQLN